jgi:transcriptional regulator of arginine metabolism
LENLSKSEIVLSNKQKRQSILIKLIESGEVNSQEDAVQRLLELGLNVTQATVSRDFTEIGATKIHQNNEIKYIVGNTTSTHGASFAWVFREFVIKKAVSGNIIVLGTPPGHASMVAASIDRENISGILGVVAGDDTLFICCQETLPQKNYKNLLNNTTASDVVEASNSANTILLYMEELSNY